MRVSNDEEVSRASRAGHLRTVLDQQPAESVPLHLRLDKQTVEIGFPVGSALKARESHDDSGGFEDENIPGEYLIRGDLDDLSMRENCRAVTGIRQPGAALKLLKVVLLGRERLANHEAFHHTTAEFRFTIRSIDGPDARGSDFQQMAIRIAEIHALAAEVPGTFFLNGNSVLFEPFLPFWELGRGNRKRNVKFPFAVVRSRHIPGTASFEEQQDLMIAGLHRAAPFSEILDDSKTKGLLVKDH